MPIVLKLTNAAFEDTYLPEDKRATLLPGHLGLLVEKNKKGTVIMQE